eukprot:CAMPEP_0184055830 /NCGR_PEP_ID=MMETSP0956-20121227/7404_1 /TAXON_ID=627963 /ORGANISM="Aplanochytrium sp, Strain PBS07" /LENGTH=264 /DNA_ID=CAMNT_0026349717 /DNA_START=772 /DNA_END=1566 /DNA_ORIENTATION=-
MCGKGVPLIEAAICWPEAHYVGCDSNLLQLELAKENARLGGVFSNVSFMYCRSDLPGGVPIKESTVDKIMVDLPFGKQFGSVQGNERLYPYFLCEMARILRVGGRCVLLTSAESEIVLRASLAEIQRGGTTSAKEPGACNGAFKVLYRLPFLLFSKMKARIYVLERTTEGISMPENVYLKSKEALEALKGHDEANKRKWQQVKKGELKEAGHQNEQQWDFDKPTLFVCKLQGNCKRLPWDDGTSWENQWRNSRPLLCTVARQEK